MQLNNQANLQWQCSLQRKSIEQWFRRKGAAVSPLTMKPLASAKLVPNPVLQEMLSKKAMLAGAKDGLPYGV